MVKGQKGKCIADFFNFMKVITPHVVSFRAQNHTVLFSL